jgi:glycine/D-amino acid oxidase-like deaminating enzyme
MPGYGSRFWADRTAASRRRSYPKFRGDSSADVVVIGGGLTGCASAYALAASGLDVVLVEADRLAGGATAGGIGAILPQPDAGFASVEREAGVRAARVGWNEARRSALDFAAVLRKLQIRCDLTASSLAINAATMEDAVALRREQSARKKAGVDAPLLTARAARAALTTDSAGAIRLREAFDYDPVRAALGLAAAAQAKGARIFERSSVRRTRFTRKDAQVALPDGAIRTRGVLVATGEPGALFGQLRRHVRRAEGYAVVTHPLAAAMRREVGARQGVLTEVGPSPHWLRWLPDDRILFCGAVGPPVNDRKSGKVLVQRTGQLMYELSVRYPAISGLPAAWAWSTPVVSTPDGLPWIGPHRNYPHHFFGLAMGWHGDPLAWFSAKAAVRHFRGEARREDEAFGFARYL